MEFVEHARVTLHSSEQRGRLSDQISWRPSEGLEYKETLSHQIERRLKFDLLVDSAHCSQTEGVRGALQKWNTGPDHCLSERRLAWPLRKDDTHKSRSVTSLCSDPIQFSCVSHCHYCRGTSKCLQSAGVWRSLSWCLESVMLWCGITGFTKFGDKCVNDLDLL